MPVKDFIFGRPLATSQERAEQIGPAAGIPIFGLDAISSAGYGPEAALTILLPLGLLGAGYIVPISTSIVVLLAIVYFSYLQTIKVKDEPENPTRGISKFFVTCFSANGDDVNQWAKYAKGKWIRDRIFPTRLEPRTQ
jgi:hypothetical protein